MNEAEIRTNLDIFEDDELIDLLGGDNAIIPIDNIPEDQLID